MENHPFFFYDFFSSAKPISNEPYSPAFSYPLMEKFPLFLHNLSTFVETQPKTGEHHLFDFFAAPLKEVAAAGVSTTLALFDHSWSWIIDEQHGTESEVGKLLDFIAPNPKGKEPIVAEEEVVSSTTMNQDDHNESKRKGAYPCDDVSGSTKKRKATDRSDLTDVHYHSDLHLSESDQEIKEETDERADVHYHSDLPLSESHQEIKEETEERAVDDGVITEMDVQHEGEEAGDAYNVNRFTIKKRLTYSDTSGLTRLLLWTKLVETHILPFLGRDQAKNVNSRARTKVMIWDLNTQSGHLMNFKKVPSSNSYVLNGTWGKQFLKRRELKEGDEIGMYWDDNNSYICFSVLKRAGVAALR